MIISRRFIRIVVRGILYRFLLLLMMAAEEVVMAAWIWPRSLLLIWIAIGARHVVIQHFPILHGQSECHPPRSIVRRLPMWCSWPELVVRSRIMICIRFSLGIVSRCSSRPMRNLLFIIYFASGISNECTLIAIARSSITTMRLLVESSSCGSR